MLIIIRKVKMYKFIVGEKDFKDFIPRDAGFEECASGKSYGPAIRNYYLIHYVEKGEGMFKNESGEYKVSEGEAFLIRPGEVTYYEADKEKPWSYVWIGFTGALAEKFHGLPDIIRPDGSIFGELKSLNSAMIEERLCALTFRLYCNLFEDKTEPDYISKVIGYINSEYAGNIKINNIAESLKLNRKYLARIFKERCGVSMKEYLIRKRLTEGKALLEKGYTVTEASLLSGYSDAFAFSKAFKAFFGKSPKTLKKAGK